MVMQISFQVTVFLFFDKHLKVEWLDHFVVVHLLSHVQLSVAAWTTACQAPLSSTVFQTLLKFMFIESVRLSNHLILCHPLLLLPSIFPSIWVFSNESALHIRWPKYWSFSISPSSGYSGLISFNINWFDLFAVQGTVKSLLQHHNFKASIVWCSAFFIVQFSHDYWKNHSFDYTDLRQHSDISAFYYAKFVIAFLPRSSSLLISRLQSCSALIR